MSDRSRKRTTKWKKVSPWRLLYLQQHTTLNNSDIMPDIYILHLTKDRGFSRLN
jgi:hypothetical protein